MAHDNLKSFAAHADRSRIRFRFIGLRRSGNHGLISWVIQNTPGRNKVFYNNCRPTADPFVRFPQAQLFGSYEGTYQKKDYIRLLADQPDFLSRVNTFFISYEDVSLRALDTANVRPLSAGCDDHAPRNVYVLRDFANWAASFWPHLGRKIGSKDQNRGQPLRHMSEFMRMCEMWKDNMKLVRDPEFCEKHSITVLRYDDWISDEAYRRKALKAFSLTAKKIDIPEVSTFGGGSSFDGLSKQGDPQAMETSERWKLMIETPQFRQMMLLCLSDDEFRAVFADEYPDSATKLMDALGLPAVQTA
jgi:hypothetical protein